MWWWIAGGTVYLAIGVYLAYVLDGLTHRTNLKNRILLGALLAVGWMPIAVMIFSIGTYQAYLELEQKQ